MSTFDKGIKCNNLALFQEYVAAPKEDATKPLIAINPIGIPINP